MTACPPYTIIASLAQGSSATIFRAVRNVDRCPVILKVLDPRLSRPKDLERLQHEHEIGTLLDAKSIVKPLALETYQGMPALVLENFGGRSLEELLGAPMTVGRFLPLAMRIAEAVADVHRHGVVHRDLKPGNIIISSTTGEVKIADFGLASRLPRVAQPAPRAQIIEGSLPYLSPEQTGRMNRAVDDRADLYALGIIFHQMLTARLPFEAKDPVEWVHCHVARAPRSPAEVVPEIPDTLARIVQKLLSKMPEDRYQSARGLEHDLGRCLEQWNRSGKIERFALAEHDATGRLQLPQKLFGRAVEMGRLHDTFERVVATGATELLLVSGYSGIGKSSLVRELDQTIVRERAFFLRGKFESCKRDIPYATLVSAFRELVLEILAESEPRIAEWRQRLLDALGVNGRLIVDVIPPVELVIGPQPPVPELPPTEAQNRLRLVFRHFIGVFARREHPLVIFLDDLQWADWASLSLLEELTTHPDVRHLLVIGAHRDNEVSASHPLALTLSAVRNAGGRVSDILLGPMLPEHLAAFVGEALHCSMEEAAPLSNLIHERTGGNPFFAGQFLLSLHEEGLIAFDEHARAFRWDIAKIRLKSSTDNVVDLMVDKLRRLPPATQKTIERLACMGSAVELGVLSMVHGRSEADMHTDLWEAVHAGLVVCVGGACKFLHDRIQEAAYSLIPEEERAALHLGIGRLLLAHTAPEALEERVFEIVNQLDRGAALITAPDERERVAELNLVAGKRAESSTAYVSALKYLAAGATLLPEDRWDRRYELTFALELHRADCEYLTGAREAAEMRLSSLSRRARSLVDLAAVTCARLSLHTTVNRADRAVEACLDYLRRVGVQWSPHPTKQEVEQEYERIWQQLGDRSIETLVDLPPMTDPDCRATMDVLTWTVSPAHLTDENLLGLVVGRMVNLCLAHGNSDSACIAYVVFGMFLGSRFNDQRKGYRFGKLGLDLLNKSGPLRFKGRVQLIFGSNVNPWSRHVHTGLSLVRRAFVAAQETGDLMYASYSRTCAITLLLVEGAPLGEVQREAEAALDLVRKAGFGLIEDTLVVQLQLVRALRGSLPEFASFDDTSFDEARFEAHLRDAQRPAFASCWYWIRKLEARLFAGHYAEAVSAAAKAQEILWTSPSFFEIADYHYYGALARAAHHDTASDRERSQILTALAAHHRQLETWAQTCPENFRNRAALVAAEIARIEGRDHDATRFYEEAIRSSRENGFVHNEAIAYETAARFYHTRGFELFADTYLREARDRYLRWGADGKVRALERIHPQLAPQKHLAPATTMAMRAEQLDLLSVTKASQTISGEIVLDKLVRTLLEVVLEQGGAERACLIVPREGGLSIEAEADLRQKGAVLHLHGSDGLLQRFPATLVHYALRTKEDVILSDAAAHAGKFAGDDYIARNKPRSILCMRIVRQAEVVGLLYLENNLLAGAFTLDRLTALSLLAMQAAISLENALLLAKEQAARAAAEDAERRAALLAEAGVLLSESLDYEETFARLGRLCVRSLADYCIIDIVEGREIRRLPAAYADPEKGPALKELERRYPPRWDSRHPAATVLRSGEPLLLPVLSDEVLRATSEDESHYRLLRDLGTRTAIVVPLVARGQTLGVITLVSGAADRRFARADLELAEEVARRAGIALDNARLYRASQEAVRARSEFLTVASHELNTPLTSLRLAVQSLCRLAPLGRTIDPQAMSKMLELVARQEMRMTKLVNDLLDVAHIEAGPLPLKLADVDLGALVREVLARFEADLSQSRCVVSIHAGAPVVGQWDRSHLDQVVTNLLSNAIKFGSGEPIEIFLDAEGGTARLAIRDHGIGIGRDQRDRIFGRFERAVSERHYGGLGLGLYICRRIVEDHGGAIRCDSRPGAGSTFIIELPITPPS
ncbi:Signal transduction histidine kinase CheA [Minicystis rosea]|nr:Signal transduction histidine kinase CheA [Minicystis rosea]